MTVDGDATGLHVLVARGASAYTWRTAATLTEPGVDTDQWIGQACLTGSGRRAAVVYAPRQIVNSAAMFTQGALAAVVDLENGHVTKLPQSVSIAYHNPGCGSDETAAFSSRRGDGQATSRVLRVDAASGSVLSQAQLPGQVTSAVPGFHEVVAARGSAIVAIRPHRAPRVLTRTTGVPAFLSASRPGEVAYETVVGQRVTVHRWYAGKDAVIARGTSGQLGLQSVGDRHFVVGSDPSAKAARLPAGWTTVAVPARSTVSSAGQLAISASNNGHEAAGAPRQVVRADDAARAVHIAAVVVATRRTVRFDVRPRALDPRSGVRLSPALRTTRPAAVAVSGDLSTDTTDPDRACAVTRNDPKLQTLQPSPQMGEWAVDLAVQGRLTVARPANWNQDGLPAYTPQGLFPPHPAGAPVKVPAQVFLGVLAQESNMWQASSHAVDGETGNVEQGGYYGAPGRLSVDWANADCGYGMAQVTTGMSVASGTSTYSATQQKAIAVDYAANAAAGLQILQDKWTQLKSVGVMANGGDPQYVENWYFALWAYNTGYHAKGEDASGQYGLGWSNNPINPDFTPGRAVFLTGTYDDAKHPNRWSYEERVIGWANTPLLRTNFATGGFQKSYAAAFWPGGVTAAQPLPATFCTQTKNQCDTQHPHQPGDYPSEPAGACQRDDLKCWWHYPAMWASCSGTCGTEKITYAAGAAEPARPKVYPPNCTAFPSGAVIVDDVPDSTPAALGCSGKNYTSKGALTFKFGSEVSGGVTTYPSKVDFHQIGAGFGGHFWFTHTEAKAGDVNSDPTKLASQQLLVTGTWTPTTRLAGWTRVVVHVPDHGDATQAAHYRINLGNNTFEDRYIPTDIEKNTWVNLGVFNFVTGSGPTSLSLNNAAWDGDGTSDVAWDAVGFVHLAAKPKDFVVQLGDSYTSGEGAGDYLPQSNRGDIDTGLGATTGTSTWNSCRRSVHSWLRSTTIPGRTSSLGKQADALDASSDVQTLACSGAYTFNVDDTNGIPYAGRLGENREMPQAQSGFLDANTTLVTLTLTGNDAGFGSVLAQCGNPFDSCPSDSEVYGKIDNAMPGLKTVLRTVHSKAPNAKIILLGYPRLFHANTGTNCGSIIANDDKPRINGWADYLTSQEQAAAASSGVTVTFRSPNAEFEGRRICDDNEEINDYVASQVGSSDFNCPLNPVCPSMESFHPKAAGTLLYAQTFLAAIKASGYK